MKGAERANFRNCLCTLMPGDLDWPPMKARGRTQHLSARQSAAKQDAVHSTAVQQAAPGASYQDLVEQIPAIVYVDRPQDNYHSVYVSPQLETILQIDPARWIEEDLWVEHLHPDDRERVLAEYEGFLQGGPHVRDYRMIRTDGKVVWIRDRGKLVRDEHGNVVLEQGIMVDITEQKEAEELLRKADAIGRDFTELALQGASPERMLERLAEIAGNPVALEDAGPPARHLRCAWGGGGGTLPSWARHGRVVHEEEGMTATRVLGAEPPCAFIQILFRDKPWGRVHLLEVARPIGEMDVLALDRAAAAIGLALLAEQDAANLADRAASALLFDVLHNKHASPEEVVLRARELGADLDGRRLAALVLGVPDLPHLVCEPEFSERERLRVRTSMLQAVRDSIAHFGCIGLAGAESDRVAAIIALPKGKLDADVLERIGWDALRRIEADPPGLQGVVGLSDETSIGYLARAIEEACEAATYAGRAGSRPLVSRFTDLGIQHLLIRLAEEPDLARFVESTLRPLLDHDARSSSPLLPTLLAYLDQRGKKVPTARALHIGRRSLYYRLANIERLLGHRLDDRETLMRLEVALRGLELLRDRAPGYSALF